MDLRAWFDANPALVQGDFAKKVGVSREYLNGIINSGKRPSPNLAAAIEQATGGAVTRMELLYGDRPALSGASLATDRAAPAPVTEEATP